MSVHLYVMRHGQSHVNLADLTVSHRDEPLTDVGVAQAEAAAVYIAENLQLDGIFASTVARAAQTAQLVSDASGVALQSEGRLREIGTAHPDGTAVSESDLRPYVPKMWGTQRPYEPVTKGGESWMQFRSRVGSFLESIVPVRGRFGDPTTLPTEHDNEHYLVVCHAGVIEAIFEYVFEKGPWSAVAIHTSHTGLTHLQYSPMADMPDWWLHFHNRIVHLPPDLVT
ncbi:histidine phosphatase family protein [Candidatus Nanopelagicales bacterium]|nr:histidine phosphatase family protein [Candidatus Nanopelagicales bacterium]